MKILKLLPLSLVAVCGFLQLQIYAAPQMITSDTTIVVTRNSGVGNAGMDYAIADGVTLTISASNNPGNNGSLYSSSTYAFNAVPSGSNGTGQVIFSGQGSAGNFSSGSPSGTHSGGAIYITTSSNTFTNATFQSYWAYGNGGAISVATGGNLTLRNINVMNNGAVYTGGAMNIGASATVAINGGTFNNNQTIGNYPLTVSSAAQSGNGGAIALQGSTITNRSSLYLNNVSFTNNQAVGTSGNGGALYLRTANVYMLDPTFTNNQASGSGGAIFAPDGTILTIDVTKNALYSGNVANGSTTGGLTTPSGTSGGFLALNNTNTNVANINIVAGQTLTIGTATNVVADTFSIPSTGTLNINVANTGSLAAGVRTGTLVLNGASTNVNGNINIAAGTVLLGNNAAAFGGKINLSQGATFGGSGTIINGAVVNASAGAIIQVGTGTGSSGLLTFGDSTTATGTTNGLLFAGTGTLVGSGTLAGAINLGGDLTVNNTDAANPLTLVAALSGTSTGNIIKTGAGTLVIGSDNTTYVNAVTVNGGALNVGAAGKLGGNVTINNGGAISIKGGGAPAIVGALNLNGGSILFDNTAATSALNVGSLHITGSNTVDITKLATGTYTLFNTGAAVTDPLSFATTYKNSALNGRTAASYTGLGTNAVQLTIAVTSATRTWTGATDTQWNMTTTNWAEAEKQFQDGDVVVFAGTGAANPITVNASGVVVSDMAVSNASGTYTIAGGSITGDPTSWQGVANATTGKLTKTGAGALAFTNTTNNFQGGIDISGGAITFTNSAQLGTLNATSVDQGITFSSGSSALIATGSGITLTNAIKIGSGATATLDTQTNTVTYSGTLSTLGANATFDKVGTGTLRMTSDNTAYTGATSIDAGILDITSTGKLGGNITIKASGTLSGLGVATGNVIANAGSYLRIGGTNTDNVPQNFTVGGTLSLNQATVGLKSKIVSNVASTDKVTAGSLQLTGTNIFDFTGMLTSGTYTLVNTTGGVTGFSATNFITYNNGALIDERASPTYVIQGNNLSIILQYANRALTWSGTADNIWRGNYGNWQGANTFSGGDSVLFNGTADAAYAANRAITIDDGGVIVSDMTVTGSANYTFTGGGILGTTANTTITSATGRLTMNGTGKVTLNNAEANSFSGGIYVNSGTIAGTTLALGTNAVVVAAPGTLMIDQASFDNYAGTVSGSGAFTKAGSGTIGLASTGTIATSTFNVNAGTFVMHDGVVNVNTINVNSGGALAFDGGGTFKATTLNLNNGGTMLVNAPVSINASTFNHAGLLAIGSAASNTNPYSTVTLVGNYIGQGGTLRIGTVFATGTSDLFQITGNASGNALLDIVHPATEQGLATTGLGIKVVSITGTDNLNLALTHRINAGLYDYDLIHETGSYYLRSTISSDIVTANAAPAVALLAGRASLDTIQNRLGEVRLDPARASGLWIRDAYRQDTLQKSWLSDVKVDTNVIQVGADHAFINPNGTPDNWILGAYYNYTSADGKMPDASKVKNDSNGAGVYAIFKRGAFYIEGLVKVDFSNSTIETPYTHEKTKGTTIGGSLEAGYTLPLSRFGTLEPQAQVIYQYIKLESSSDNQIPRYSYEDFASPTVRGGLRWYKDFNLGATRKLTPWIRFSAAYDAKSDYSMTVIDSLNQIHTFDNSLGGARYILDGGFSVQISNRWSVNLSGGVETGPKNEGWFLTAGVRYSW